MTGTLKKKIGLGNGREHTWGEGAAWKEVSQDKPLWAVTFVLSWKEEPVSSQPLPGYLEWSSQHVCFQDGKLQVHDGILMGQDSGFSWPIGTIRVGTVKPSHSQRREWGSRLLCKPIQEGRQKILYFYLFFNLIFFSFLEGVFFIKNMICFWDNNNVLLLLLFSHSGLSDSLQPRGLQHARQPSDMTTMQPVEKKDQWF